MANLLDCRGLQCPEPVTRCRTLIREAAPDNLEVVVDNAAALENVSRFLERNGYGVVSRQVSEKEWRISGVKSGRAPQAEQEEASSAMAAMEGGRALVLLTTETLGRGDDGLGAKLMLNFLGSLPELGSSLWRIILLNGAVKLSTGGEALERLQALEAAGVSILVCGTCLGHYGILEQKRVGETTNMMDVVTSLALAQKIIRP